MNSGLCAIVFFASLDIVTSSAIIYRSKLINANVHFDDEAKALLQQIAIKQLISLQLVLLMNIAHYFSVRYGKKEVNLIHYGYWIFSFLVQGWLFSIIVEQISMIY